MNEQPNMDTDGIPNDMVAAVQDAHGRFTGALQGLIRDQATPESLYHYTDSMGLFGILESGTIRLTNLFGLNDPSELLHGVTYACEILNAEAKAGHQAAKVFAQRATANLAENVQHVAHVFVASFSRDDDELGQWRAYADNGHGFTLRFDGAALEHCYASQTTEDCAKLGYWVSYDDDALKGHCSVLTAETMRLIALPQGKRLSNDIIDRYMRLLMRHWASSSVQMAILYKHAAYVAEREYRLMHLRSIDDSLRDVKHRAKRHSLVSFAEFDWKRTYPEALREIVIGPAAAKESAQSFIYECLAKSGLDPDKIEVRQSEIPYRS